MIRELEFKILCERHSDEIYRYARALLSNQADAEDATQEVLLRLWRHLPRLNPFNLRAWLLQTTRYYCLDQIRRRSNRAAPLPLEDGVLEEQPDEFAVNPSLAADSSLRLEQARKELAHTEMNEPWGSGSSRNRGVASVRYAMNSWMASITPCMT